MNLEPLPCMRAVLSRSDVNIPYIPIVSESSQKCWVDVGLTYKSQAWRQDSLQGMDCGVFVGCCNLGGNDVDPEGPPPQLEGKSHENTQCHV